MRVVAHDVVLGGIKLTGLDEVDGEEVSVVLPQGQSSHPLQSGVPDSCGYYYHFKKYSLSIILIKKIDLGIEV